ncbi:heavy-metal-associated domain-containing protein [Jejuia pallidilutea]|jgi:copper chaperone CopZ|uniref:Copper chaperone CopZ n=1 Tax=Jejuia pallidilutea TaxID=504487 RepID=A0A090WAH9_9FLAO|nr:heavy-metal-associated domain-containing protein [Jejuia pallidilutea]PQV50467.1 copper chaperone CopZ [Jejuia pallidilutea]GAL65774.1 hypothetical protein JCM19301_3459 [Jejuia pallidilutea]GAL72459.1 hypothetical protein JCM19302_1581 [Jejuia pallidilutea]GAL88568.1 hypothetical protein JCM19538_3081 [Jejuia pallidilutea]
MRTTVIINNLQCENCKNLLDTEIQKVSGISNLDIDIATKSISFDYKTHNAMEGLRMHLKAIGYPITKDPSIIKEDLKNVNSPQKEKVVTNK